MITINEQYLQPSRAYVVLVKQLLVNPFVLHSQPVCLTDTDIVIHMEKVCKVYVLHADVYGAGLSCMITVKKLVILKNIPW